jgi:polyhydroxyalkanoate synthesis repressor PhaR
VRVSEGLLKDPEVLIRKYSDRRLYDTGASRYVKLEDIAKMVRDGIDVRVVDGRSGKDITHLIFTQIIVEDAREREIALPLQLLTQLVRASDKATHDFLTWYLNSTLDLYKKAQETVHTRLSSAKTAVSSPVDFVRNLLSGHAQPPPEPEEKEVETLRRRVEELQSRLEQRETRAPRTAKRKRPR